MEKFLDLSCKRLPDDVYEKLKELRDGEDDPIQKVVYEAYFDNLDKALALDRPCCQDTGLLHFYVTAGSEFKHMDMVEDALREATHRATCSVPLRQNTVNYLRRGIPRTIQVNGCPGFIGILNRAAGNLRSSATLQGEAAASPEEARYLNPQTDTRPLSITYLTQFQILESMPARL